MFTAEPAKSFPVEIRNHAWTRFGDSFLIAGGNGVEIGGGISDFDTIYRLERLSLSFWNPIDPINLQVQAYRWYLGEVEHKTEKYQGLTIHHDGWKLV